MITSIKDTNNIYGYCKEHKLSRYTLHLMLRFTKYRLNHLHGIFESVNHAYNLNHSLNNLHLGEIGDLGQDLINTRENPTEFNEKLQAAKKLHIGFDLVLTLLMTEWRFYFSMDALRKEQKNHESLSSAELKEIGDNIKSRLYKHAEHVVNVLVNEPVLFQNTNAYLSSELLDLSIEVCSWFTYRENIELISKNYGIQTFATIFEAKYNYEKMIAKSIEADSKPNDYDSN